MPEQKPVGRVIASEHTNTQEFRVVLADDSYLQLDDLVMVETDVPGAETVSTYGVVTESEGVYEGAFVRVRHLPDRPGGHTSGGQGAVRPGIGRPGRSRDLGGTRPRRRGIPGSRRAAR